MLYLWYNSIFRDIYGIFAFLQKVIRSQCNKRSLNEVRLILYLFNFFLKNNIEDKHNKLIEEFVLKEDCQIGFNYFQSKKINSVVLKALSKVKA